MLVLYTGGAGQDIRADHEELMKLYDGITEVIRKGVAGTGNGSSDVKTDVDDEDVLEFAPD